MGFPWRKILTWAAEQAIKVAQKKIEDKKAPKKP